MSNRILAFAAGLGALLAASAALAHDYKIGDLVIDHPWARATPKGAPAGGAFLVVTNKGKAADRLLAGTADVAGTVEIHEMAVVDGIMKMRPIAGGIEIPPGGSVTLKPGGLHVMLIGLKEPLVKGQKVKGTLIFEKAGTIAVEYEVEAIAAQGQGGHGQHMSQ